MSTAAITRWARSCHRRRPNSPPEMQIGFVLFPRLTALDLAGPWEVFTRVPDVHAHLIWTRPGPVESDSGLELTATQAFATAPKLDVLVVPGGPGQLPLMRHAPLLDFLRSRAAEVTWLCGVCTGSLLLGQAGLLDGRRATTHWLARDALRTLGAEVVEERYVFDGNVVTSAGVSAGIDMALAVTARLTDAATARSIQLRLEYDPRPPFDSGSPATAPADLVAGLRETARQFI